MRRILLPHDGTPTTAEALGPVAELATQAGAELCVLHVTAGVPAAEAGAMQAPRYVDQPQHEWPAWASEFLERLCCLGHLPSQLTLHLHLAGGDPGEQIVRYAAEHGNDLIVLAWKGHLEPARAETLRKVVRDAPCPVMVLRTDVRD